METVELPWEQIALPTSLQLNAVYFSDAQTGYLVGGDQWEAGIQLQTEDAGQSWQLDSISFASLRAFDLTPDGSAFALGLGDRLRRRLPNTREWTEIVALPTAINNDIVVSRQQYFVISGAAFQDGRIHRLDSNFQTITLDSFENELSAIAFPSPSTPVVVGYGIALRSIDGGQNWIPIDVSGDFYQDVYFPTPDVGYIVGLRGSILKTIDGGLSWKSLRNGDRLSTSAEPFRAVYFSSSTLGYIVGDDGLCWQTVDGGDEWRTVKGLPSVDFLSVSGVEGTVYISGAEGTLLRFEN